MSIAYLDPGNIESDLQSGAKAGFQVIFSQLFELQNIEWLSFNSSSGLYDRIIITNHELVLLLSQLD